MGLNTTETNNNFENSYVKSITFLVKNLTFFYNIPIKIKIFRHQTKMVLNILPILGSVCF